VSNKKRPQLSILVSETNFGREGYDRPKRGREIWKKNMNLQSEERLLWVEDRRWKRMREKKEM
jgi:hypothetical protein